jgi:hypothetical protein
MRIPAKEANRIFSILAEAKLDGFGGKCFPAAIAINRVLFEGKGKLVGAFNKAFLAQGRLKGHVAVKFGGRLWDAEGETSLEDLESWGMLDPHDQDYIEEYGEGWGEAVAYEVEIKEIGEHVNGGYGELIPEYEKRLKDAASKPLKVAKVAGLRGKLEYHRSGDVLWIDMFGHHRDLPIRWRHGRWTIGWFLGEDGFHLSVRSGIRH